MPSGAKGRKGRIGKKKAWISAYYSNQTYLINKHRKLMKRLRKHPLDAPARERVMEIEKQVASWRLSGI